MQKAEPEANKGKLIIDATVAEQAIRFSTDLELLKEARKISEALIDKLYPLSGTEKKTEPIAVPPGKLISLWRNRKV